MVQAKRPDYLTRTNQKVNHSTMSPLLRSLQLFSGIVIWLIYNEFVELWRRLGMLAVRDEALIDSYVFSAFPSEPLHCKITLGVHENDH